MRVCEGVGIALLDDDELAHHPAVLVLAGVAVEHVRGVRVDVVPEADGEPRRLVRVARVGCVALRIALFIPFADFIALILSLVWIMVVSVLLYRDFDLREGVEARSGLTR